MELWVFGYGSLMWRPGFEFEQSARARLEGYSRRFCVRSVHHRGTEARPGLVLGLDRGGDCDGLAFKVPADRIAETLGYLRAREQVNGVYREARVPVTLRIGDASKAVVAGPDGSGGAVSAAATTDEPGGHRRVMALAYLVERAHPSYAAGLTLSDQARIIRGAHGLSGDNVSYLVNTLDHLAQLGIREAHLERLRAVIGPLIARARPDAAACHPRVAWIGRGIRPARVKTKRLRPQERRRFVYRLR